MPLKTSLYIALLLFVFASCKKETEKLSTLGKEYFGYEVGQLRYYRCDSTLYNSFNPMTPRVTKNFIIRERVVSTFIDNEGNEVYRLERDISTNNDTSYSFFGLATIQIDDLGIEYYENNKRFVPLSFPIRKKRSWDGNVYNDLERQKYIYRTVDEPHFNDYLTFDESVHVNQRDEITIISEKTENYYYAKGVGMIEKNIQNIEINGSDKDGFELNWKLQSIKQ